MDRPKELETQLQQVLAEADKVKPKSQEEDFFDSMYPSLAKARAEKVASMIPPDWEEDVRTLESAMYPSMRKRQQ